MVATAFEGAFQDHDDITREMLLPEVNAGLTADAMFGTMEADRHLTSMNDNNLLMYADGICYKL